ncbi:MAG: nucleoside hydrolase [Acidimicrobiia bacterium]|nr:nucleoside hydrolase [Acidimicrobiia bacterium]
MGVPRVLVLLCLLVSLAAGCGDDAGSDDITRVIVDSDGAFDDIKAILYLLQQPDVEVVALTMSGTGIARCPAAAENTAAMLERIEAPEIPVACGRTTPLEGNNEAPAMWRDSADALGGVALPEPRPLSDLDAPALLADAIDSAGAGVVIVALGPLTNLAEAVEADPDVLDDVEMMYLMGGAVDVGGNVIDHWDAEFNIWADPKAADIVFQTDIPITLVPLDATNAVPVTPYLYDVAAKHRDVSLVSQFVADYLEASPLFGGLYHWDELTAVVARDESVVTIEDRLLTINADGATVEDPAGRSTRVATSADAAAFEDHFYQAIIGTGDTGVPAWEPDGVLTWDGTTCTYEGPDPLPNNFWIRLDNESDDFLLLVTGVYDAGTTRADFDAFLAAAEPGVPDWWLPSSQAFAGAWAHDVWPARGGVGMTGLCYVSPSQVWEVAGPKLTE